MKFGHHKKITLNSVGELTNKHAVLVWVTGVFNYRNNVGSLLGNIEQVTTRPVGKLHRIHQSFLSKQEAAAQGQTVIEEGMKTNE